MCTVWPNLSPAFPNDVAEHIFEREDSKRQADLKAEATAREVQRLQVRDNAFLCIQGKKTLQPDKQWGQRGPAPEGAHVHIEGKRNTAA